MAELLNHEQMRDLAEQETMDGFLEKLADTKYGQITVDREGDVSIALEKVFYYKFIERMMGIVDLAPLNIGNFLQSYYYFRFEVVNLKRIIRGKYSGLPTIQIIESLIPINPYNIESYEYLANAETLEGTIKRLEGTSYEPLISSLVLYEKYDALWPIEITLNYLSAMAIFHALEQLSYDNRNLVRRIIQAETDVENFLIAAKLRVRREEIIHTDEMFPSTFNIGLEKLKDAMEAKDVKPVIQSLDSPYNEILAPLYEGDVALIRSRLRRHIYEIAKRGRETNDFGFNAIMAYLVFSEIEKDDLVGISWGKTQGISSEDILKYLAI